MKVLFINTVFGKGSTGRIVAQIGSAVEANGGSYMVAYGRGEKSDDPHAYFIGSKADTYLHALLTRITDKCGFYSGAATKKLIRFIRDYQPDVIHLHNLHGYYLNIEILFDYLKTEYTGKVVWTLHDCWTFTGHCTYYTYANCERWIEGCCKCPEKKRYPSSFLMDNSRENYLSKKKIFTGVPNMTITTVSQWLKDQVQLSFLKEYPIARVYNGIDANVFRPLPSNVRDELNIGNRKCILSVSDGWDTRKGLDRLLALANQAPQDWCFVIVGLAKDRIAKLPKNCIGMERTWNQEALIQLYTVADVFYNPSSEETFGLVTAEALACGTPVVVYRTTACPELVWDKSYGRVAAFSDTVEQIITTLQEAMAEKNGEAKKTFSLEDSTTGYLALYR